MNRKSLVFLGIVAVIVLLTSGAIIDAQGARVRACATCDPPESFGDLPGVPRGPMTITSVGDALSILSFDDGTCESGLGAGVTVTDFVDFDVPTQCVQGGLDIVGLTARMNTGSAQNFAFGQAGATPPSVGAASLVAIANIPALGPCPATALTNRAVGPGAAVITGTSNFFAGLQTPTGYAGRDSNGPPAGRIWLNCGGCGMTQYSPTDLSNAGLGGNWMIRVTVEDQNCVPVELMGFDVG
jgi:hypothetical protein